MATQKTVKVKNANKENYHNSITQTTRKFEGYVFLIFKNIAGIFSFIIRYESQTMLSFVEELKKKKNKMLSFTPAQVQGCWDVMREIFVMMEY